MGALTKDRNTATRPGDDITRPVAAGVICFSGGMGAVNAAGDALPASATAGLKVVGRIEQTINNTGGIAGAANVPMRRGVFLFANSITSPLSVADLGGTALVEDDATVAKVAPNSIVAGKIIDINANGVWVEIR